MERTIDKVVKEKLNGAPKAPPMCRNVLPNGAGVELVWTNPANGQFIGSVVFRCIAPQAMPLLGMDFNAWIKEELMKLTIAPPPQAPIPPAPGAHA